MALLLKYPTPAGDFEQNVIAVFGLENLTARKTKSDGKAITLYYADVPEGVKKAFPDEEGRHVASWCAGKGWMFEWATEFATDKNHLDELCKIWVK